ncbi:MAG: hypothetical protein Kow00109_30160 [Acidobacteriota bacterium]
MQEEMKCAGQYGDFAGMWVRDRFDGRNKGSLGELSGAARRLIVLLPALALTGACAPEREAGAHTWQLETLVREGVPARLEEGERGPALVLEGSASAGLLLEGVDAGIPWEQARYLVLDVYHEDPHSDILWLEFFRRDRPESPRISAKLGILPELETQVVFPLEYLDGQRFFMERFPRQLKGTVPGRRMTAGEIGQVRVRVEPVTEQLQARVKIRSVRLTRELPPAKRGGPTVVDEIGQWKVRDWPGKMADTAAMVAQLKDLAASAQGAEFPSGWSRYGGWKGKRFQATGYFRTEYDGRRWWLVDPEGYAFLSIGVDVVTPVSSGPVTEMEDLFDWLPPEDGDYAAAWRESRGRREVSFLTANWIRAFGPDWRRSWARLTRDLLVAWGFNTVGNWSDLEFARSSRLPYVIPLRDFPTTDTLLYRDFPDVFSPEYEAAAGEFARQLEEYRDDPYLIGYFLDNEPVWAFGDNIIAAEMLATAQPSASRERLVEWLREKYAGDIAALRQAWSYELESFEALGSNAFPRLLEEASSQAEADLREFSGILVDRYLELPSRALRDVDPNHLNLGIRYAWISSELCYRAGNFFDVFSINSYTWRPDPEVVAEITRRTGKPVLIGEFHHGAIDRGLPSTGIKGVASQEERGVAYRYYVEQGFALPEVVAIHYFQWNDQPILGRFDGENYNIGLVDVANQPYRELVEAARETNHAIYEVAAGKREPSRREARPLADIYF